MGHFFSFLLFFKKCDVNVCRVHSPIDLKNLAQSAERYPSAADIRFMDCTVHEGEAIFVPSFYWHEVTSTPSNPTSFHHHPDEGNGRTLVGSEAEETKSTSQQIAFNLAVNHWFTPLFNKEFPCSQCRKQFNTAYRDVLESYIAATLWPKYVYLHLN